MEERKEKQCLDLESSIATGSREDQDANGTVPPFSCSGLAVVVRVWD